MIAIPLLKDRVAPRSTYADCILVASLKYGRVATRTKNRMHGHTSVDLVRGLKELKVNTLICGGISRETREILASENVDIIENVTGTAEEIIDALLHNELKPGYGFGSIETSKESETTNLLDGNLAESGNGELKKITDVNCLKCIDRVCLNGQNCLKNTRTEFPRRTAQINEILDSAMDVACEDERKLCRVAELVYFCLGMKYKKIGVAFCIDLLQPAMILTEVLQRFFEVHPVCCKIGGNGYAAECSNAFDTHSEMHFKEIPCNPLVQAEVLNRLETDFNIIVGLCVGIDSIFTKASKAPVTTIFVKDKSLANNPIGAIYSDYYLDEI